MVPLAIDQLSKGRVALNEHVCIQWNFETVTELGDALGLVLSAAIGKKYKRDAVALKMAESVLGSRESFGAAEKDPIYAAEA